MKGKTSCVAVSSPCAPYPAVPPKNAVWTYSGKLISANFEFIDSSENGCEIDPRKLSKVHLFALKDGGFNRISMGVQDFNEKVQKAVNRIQPEDLTRKVVGWVRELEFHSINLDLMYGLPFQTIGNFEKTLDIAIDINPDSIALFNFAYVPWMKKQMRIIKPEDLPAPEEKLNILKMSIEKLTGAGYVFIGMDHFARPDDELTVALKNKKLYRITLNWFKGEAKDFKPIFQKCAMTFKIK